MEFEEQVKLMIETDDAILLESIGEFLLNSSVGMRPFTKKEKVTAGKSWFEKHRNEFKALICKSNTVKTTIKTGRIQDRVMLVAAICDLISSLVVGISAISVAILILKEGLIVFCDDHTELGK